jgi:hypothetical protein
VKRAVVIGGVQRTILYDNTKIAVGRILGDTHEELWLFLNVAI